jgi:hypothetical protein
VVAGGDDQRIAIPAVGVEELEKPSQLRVGIRDLAVVLAAAKLSGERFRRLIGVVRVVEVYPNEPRTATVSSEPALGLGDHIAGAAFKASPA